MRFSETVKLTDPELVVSRWHEEWLAENDHPVYSPEALQFAMEQLSGTDRVRRGTVSASALGECQREQQFTFLGMPKLPPDAKNAMRMQNGSMMHLRWQMAGLTAGWLKKAEVPLKQNVWQMSGTMDGILYEGSILELKSINANGFRSLSTFGPKHAHLYQMATYLLCTGADRGVFIYECKDTQEYTEIVMPAEKLPLSEVMLGAERLWENIEERRLVEPLEKCIDRSGWKYASCPYRDRCLEIHDWEEAQP